MKKSLITKCLMLVGIFILIFSMSVYAAEPQFYDGVEKKLGTEERPFFFANGNAITIEAPSNGIGAIIKWDGGKKEQAVSAEVNVFGGSHDDETVIPTTSITMTGGTVHSIFGGGLHESHVTKSNVIINAGTISYQVNGGGASSFTLVCGCTNAFFAGDAKNSPCIVEEANVTIKSGAIFDGPVEKNWSLLYGGGEGISRTDVANLTIEGGTFSDTYVTAGGSNGYTGKANLIIKDGTFGLIVQGINRGTIDTISMNITGGTFANLYVGGETADKEVNGTYTSASLNVSGDTEITKLLPGSNGKTTTDDYKNITGEIKKGVKIKNIAVLSQATKLFGDKITFSMLEGKPLFYDGVENKLGTEEKPFFFANGNAITITKPQGEEKGAIIKWNDGEIAVPANVNVFGGSHNDNTPMTTNITMNGGTVKSIFGGGLHASHVTKSDITIESGTISFQVIGGGASSFSEKCGCPKASYYDGDAKNSPCVVEEANVTIESGAIFDGPADGDNYSLLFGGGEGINRTDVANVTIEGGTFEDTYVTAGGANGYTGEGNLVIEGGTFKGVVQGVNRGTMDTIAMNIIGGTFANLYVGGETADGKVTGLYTSALLNVSGNTEITKLLPGSNGATTTDDSTKITGEVADSANVKIGNITTKVQAKTLFEKVKFLKYEVNVSLDKTKGTIVDATSNITLIPNVTAGSAISDKTVTWSSSKSSIANVSATGVVTVASGVTTGTTTIKATSNADSTKYATCVIDIAIPVTEPASTVPVDTAIAVAAPAVGEISNTADMSKEEKDTVKEIAAKATTNLTNDATKVEEKIGSAVKENAITELAAKGVAVTDNAKILVESYLEIVPVACDLTKGTITLDITPKYNLIATVEDSYEKVNLPGSDGATNAVYLEQGKELKVTSTVTITFEIPEGVFEDGKQYFVEHKKGTKTYYYPLTINETTASFENPNGFSEFNFLPDARKGSIIYKYEDGQTKTQEYDLSDLNNKLEPLTKSGYNFIGWTINSKEYLTLTDELLTLIDGIVLEATPKFTKKTSSGGGGSTKVTKEEPKISWTNASNWAVKELESARDNNLIPDVLDKKDMTEKITRLEFAAACIKQYEKLTGKKATANETNPFIDCSNDEVLKAYKLGITLGMTENTFEPESFITREQMATMIIRTMQKAGIDTTKITKDIKFVDENEFSSWAIDGIRFMAANELILGKDDNKFVPKDTATREEALAISQRIIELFK